MATYHTKFQIDDKVYLRSDVLGNKSNLPKVYVVKEIIIGKENNTWYCLNNDNCEKRYVDTELMDVQEVKQYRSDLA
jgi:hypothetical protein